MSTCAVNVSLVDLGLEPVAGVVSFTPIPETVGRVGNALVAPAVIGLPLSAAGTGVIDLVPGLYSVTVAGAGGWERHPAFTVTVPVATIAYLAQLIQLPPPPTLNAAEQAVLDAQAARDVANLAAANADADRIAAQTANTAAQVAKGAAEASEDAAAASAAAASSSAAAASTSASGAASDRTATAADRTQTGLDRTAAATSATASAASQAAAAASASAGATSAAASQASRLASESARDTSVSAKAASEAARDAAQISRTGAETAETAAETAQAASQSAKTASETARDAAAASATSATGSATTSTANAASALSSKNAAAASETAAASSATAAASSASAASTSASGALTDANRAVTARTGAEAAQVSASGSAATATTQATAANLSAGQAAGSAASASAIYGSTAAQQTAVATAQAQASLAQGYAASASSVVQQDLSGVTAQALHRSPNAVTSMFIYDTSKDSDGGAWTEKCQHTSWWNEPIMGKWLGAHTSEVNARYEGATLGLELNPDAGLDSATGWNSSTGISFVDGKVVFVGVANGAGTSRNLTTLDVNKTYQITVVCDSNPAGGWSIFFGGYSGPITYGSGTFTWRVKPTGNTLIVLGGATGGTNATFSLFSIREITTLTTASSDYFQLTTDGKFYRLRKNLILTSSTFGGFGNGGSVATLTIANGQGPSGGVAYKLVPTASSATAGYISSSWFNVAVPGTRYSFSIRAKAGEYPRIGVRGMYNPTTGYMFHGTIDLTNGTAVTNGGVYPVTAAPDPRGNGYYIIKVEGLIANNNVNLDAVIEAHNATTGAQQDFAADGTSGIFVTEPQYESGAFVTAYEENASSTTFTETFRGNKRDFPRLAGIVTDLYNLTIYDLTEPGRPMWMRFLASAANNLTTTRALLGANTQSSVAAMNGIMATGATNNSGYQGSLINFVSENIPYFTHGVNGSFRGNIARRNDSLGFNTVGGFGNVVGTSVNNIAMTVLSDAPLDPTTGLKVPTIAIATNSGVSVIKHNGTVVAVGTAGGAQGDLGFLADGRLFLSPISGVNAWYAFLTSKDFATSSRYSFYAYDNVTEPVLTNTPGAEAVTAAAVSASNFLTGTVSGTMAISKPNTTKARGLVTRIKNAYNTGWLAGDVRRAYLSDTEVGSVAANIQTEDFSTYADDAALRAVWSQGIPANISLVSGRMRMEAAGGWVARSWPTVIGRVYRISVTVALNVSPAIRLGSSVSSAAYGQFSSIPVGTSRSVFLATGTSFWASAYFSSSLAHEFSSFVLEEVVADRSYKATFANINGTLTRAQLASGTSLVGYSGWSAANYLEEPFSADLEFGTGEWSASAWVNVPATLSAINFPVIGPELVENGTFDTDTAWSKDASTTISGGVLTFPTSGVYSAGQFVAIKRGRAYLCSFDISNYVGGSVYFRLAYGGDLDQAILSGNGTKTFYLQVPSNSIYDTWNLSLIGVNANMTIDNVSMKEVALAPIAQRSALIGSSVSLGLNAYGRLTAEAFDGTSTRTVTTSASYNTAQWLKAEACYTTDGSLGIRVNGREVAVTRGTPLLTLNSRRNLLTQTEAFNESDWQKYAMSVTANAGTAPNGTLTADLIYPSSSTTDNSIYRGGFPTVQKTHSVYAKASGKNWLVILKEGTSGGAAWFDLANGVVGTTSAGYTGATITSVGSGWYRCSVTSTSGFSQYIAFGAVDADNTTTVTASGTNGILLWGAQLELGTVATEYQRIGATPETNVAPLTIGNSFAADAPFPGSIALLKIGATVPTADQSVFMYEQEKQMFRENAASVLPDTGALVDMAYDDATDRWVAISGTNESYWTGLVRNSVTPVPAGSYTKVVAGSGLEMSARVTTNPGVDVTIPAYGLREELVKRAESAAKLSKEIVVYDYVGGFTATTAVGSTAITSAAGLTYPTSYIGARITGTGIPANTTILGVSGTTIYISAPATAAGTAVSMTFLDFILPIGMEAKAVMSAGLLRQEGATKDYTRLFDGFAETIRFAVAPGATAWVQVQATKGTVQ